jgi:hypothetical protein
VDGQKRGLYANHFTYWHNETDRKTNTPIVKPDCVTDYDKNMGTVDRSDMMISSVECVRKSFKWYKKFFFHLLDITLLNSYALYNVKTRKNFALTDFQLALIREIFRKFHTPRPTSRPGRSVSGDQTRRLTERHFPIPVPPTPSKAKPARKCLRRLKNYRMDKWNQDIQITCWH